MLILCVQPTSVRRGSTFIRLASAISHSTRLEEWGVVPAMGNSSIAYEGKRTLAKLPLCWLPVRHEEGKASALGPENYPFFPIARRSR